MVMYLRKIFDAELEVGEKEAAGGVCSFRKWPGGVIFFLLLVQGVFVEATVVWEGTSSETETSGEGDGGVFAGDADLLTCGIVAEDGFGGVVEFEDIHLALGEDLPEGRLNCRGPRMKLQQCHFFICILEYF
jgi:hypothetical protein